MDWDVNRVGASVEGSPCFTSRPVAVVSPFGAMSVGSTNGLPG